MMDGRTLMSPELPFVVQLFFVFHVYALVFLLTLNMDGATCL